MNLMNLLIEKVYAQNNVTDFAFLRFFTGDFNQAWQRIVNFALLIIAIIAFIYLIVSGVQYITAGGDAQKAQTARQGIINAIIGVIIVILAWSLLRFIVGRIQ